MIEKEGERKEGSKLWDDVSVFYLRIRKPRR